MNFSYLMTDKIVYAKYYQKDLSEYILCNTTTEYKYPKDIVHFVLDYFNLGLFVL